MPETQPASPLRTWTLMLAVLTIGLIALMAWYYQHTQARLDAHQAEIRAKGEALTASQVAHTGLQEKLATTIDQHRAQEADLKGQLATTIDQHKARETALLGDLDQAAKAQAEIKAQAQAKQEEQAATQAELQQRLQAAGQEIETLKGEIATLHQAATQAAADHEAHILQVTDDLTAEVVKYRTLLVGSEPERAALMETYEHRLQAVNGELIKTRQSLEAERHNLATLDQTLSQTKYKSEELKEALSAATVKIQTTESALTAEREALASLRQEHEAALTAADGNLKDAAARLEAALVSHSTDKGEAEALIAQLNQQIEANATAHAAEMSEAKALMAQLQQQIAQLQQQHEVDETALATQANEQTQAEVLIAQLQQQHEADEAALAGLQGEHENLRGTLEHTRMAHSGAQTELDRLTQEAAQAKVALAEELAVAQDRIATLSADLDAQRQQAAEALAKAEAERQQATAEMEAQRKNLVTQLAQAKAELDKQRKQAAEELAAAGASADQAQKRLRDVWSRLTALGGQATDQGILLALAEKEVRFPAGKAVLPAGQIPSLDGIAAALVAFPELKVRIEGHTDSSGRDETNLALSQARAEAVMAALVARGVAADRLTAVGLGKDRPVASNETAAGRSQNRRVELYVLAP